MAPSKKTPLPPAPEEELVEDIEPGSEEPRQPNKTVTFILEEPGENEIEEYETEDEDDDDDDDDDDGTDDELATAVGQLTQLMMTEEGEAITDVLDGIRESIEKQNKILYKGLQLLESRFAKRP